MKARLITRRREVLSETQMIEMVVWEVPEPVDPSKHLIKYRLVYIVDGERVVGYDNERGKGDHRHLDGDEHPYEFTTIDALVEDFLAEVAKRRVP